MAQLGENINPRSWPWAEASLVVRVTAIGGGWVRVVLTQNRDYRPILKAFKERGQRIIAAFDGDSLGMDPSKWAELVAWYVEHYGDLIDVWQFFNECDMPPEATHSWPMTIPEVRTAVTIVRSALPLSAYLLTPGLGNGYGWYRDEIDWHTLGCQGLATQGIYGRWPDPGFSALPACRFGAQDEVLGAVAARARDLGIDAWITEWGFIDAELGQLWPTVLGATARKLAADRRFIAALHFQLFMPGFGVLAEDGSETPAYRSLVDASPLQVLSDTSIATAARRDTSTIVTGDASVADPTSTGGTMHPVYQEIDEDTLKAIEERGWTPAADPAVNRNEKGERVSQTTLCLEGAVHYSYGEARFIYAPFG